ncbi:hypothetical protein MRX96_033069 [Rhipicephalus microplus]
MGCCHSCCPRDDEYPPLLGGSQAGHSGFVSVLNTADDERGSYGGRPRAVVRPRSVTYSEGSLVRDDDYGLERVRPWSYSGSRGVHSMGSSSDTLTGDISVTCSTDTIIDEQDLREFLRRSEEVSVSESLPVTNIVKT